MTLDPNKRVETPRDEICHLVRNHILAVRMQHRNILKSLIQINELSKQFELELTATKDNRASRNME